MNARAISRAAVAHVYSEYFPGQPADTHAGILADGRFDSHLLVERVVVNGAAMPPNSAWLGTTSWSRTDAVRRRLERTILPALWEHRFTRFVGRELQRRQPSILHAHMGTTGARLAGLKECFPVPYVVTFYGADGSQCLRDPAWVAAYQRLFAVVDCVIVLCEAVRDRLVAIGCPADRVTIWNHPADLSRYPYQRRTPAAATRFITAARFVEKKGYPTLLAAFRRFLDSERKGHLTILGYGPLRERIVETIRRLELGDHVSLHDGLSKDFHSIFSDLLNEQDIFVLPSQTAADGDDEGGPALTLVFAQAAGLPVICTGFPGSERSVVEGVSGLLVPEGDPAALAQRMAELSQRPERWNALGEAGAGLVREHFALASQIARLAEIYAATLARPPAPTRTAQS